MAANGFAAISRYSITSSGCRLPTNPQCEGRIQRDNRACSACSATRTPGRQSPDGIDQARNAKATPKDEFYKDTPSGDGFWFSLRAASCTKHICHNDLLT